MITKEEQEKLQRGDLIWCCVTFWVPEPVRPYTYLGESPSLPEAEILVRDPGEEYESSYSRRWFTTSKGEAHQIARQAAKKRLDDLREKYEEEKTEMGKIIKEAEDFFTEEG